jgi:hypothetical protein
MIPLARKILVVLAILMAGIGINGCSRAPAKASSKLPDLSMSSELRSFLAEEELDDVLTLRDNVKSLTPEDTSVVRKILEDWEVTQAVSNLLNYSDLIPERVRLAALERGLAESREEYYTVSAIVGLGNIKADTLSPEERHRIATTLRTIICNTKNCRATLASVALHEFSVTGDAPKVIGLMVHENETVRHNLRAWLFDSFGDKSVAEFSIAVRKSDLPPEAQDRLIEEFGEYKKNPNDERQERLRNTLFPYIPNLHEYEHENQPPLTATPA